MPRHYDRDERSHEKSHGSPKRRKRSRSRDRHEKSRKRSPDHSKYNPKNERILENIALAGCLDAPFFGEAGTLTVAVQGKPS